MTSRGDQQPDETMLPDRPAPSASAVGIGRADVETLMPYGVALSPDAPINRVDRPLEFLALDHIAIRVADIRRAEEFYHDFFQLDVRTRARRVGDDWEPMEINIDWDEGIRTGYYPGLVYLGNGPLKLVLLNAGRGAVMAEPRLEHLSVRVTSETLAALRGAALVRSFPVTQDTQHSFRFFDPFGITWHLHDGTGEGS